MKIFYYFFFSLLLIPIGSYGQSFEWVREIKGITYDYNDFIVGQAVDSEENSYTIGDTESFLFDLDPTPDGVEIIDNSTIQNFGGTYLVKVDAAGNYVWGLTFGTYKRGDHAVDVKIGTDGMIYAFLSIEYYNAAENIIDSEFKIYKITPAGTIVNTVTIPQYYGNGNLILADSFDLDAQNNMFISGWYTGAIPFSTDNPSVNLPQVNIARYVFKMDTTGEVQWSKQLGAGNNARSELQIGPDGNVNLIMDSNNGYSLYNLDNATSATNWQRDFANQQEVTFHVSNSGFIILGEKSVPQVDVDPSENVVNIIGYCKFMIFLDSSGNFVAVKKITMTEGTNVDFTSVTTDDAGNYWLGGRFYGTIDFDASTSIHQLNAGLYWDSFLLEYDAARNFDHITQFGQEFPLSTPYNICETLLIKKITTVNDSFYLAGEFNRVCDFDPSPTASASLNSINSSTYNHNGFMQKLGPAALQTPDISARPEIIAYPNPVTNTLHFTNNDVTSVDIYDVSGRLLRSAEVIGNSINVDNLATGHYVVKVSVGGSVSFAKIIKQ